MRWRFRIVKLSDGSVMDYGPKVSAGSNPTASVGTRHFTGLRSHCDRDGTGDDKCSGKKRYASYAMAARVPADPNFWIGPAEEISSDLSDDGPPAPIPGDDDDEPLGPPGRPELVVP